MFGCVRENNIKNVPKKFDIIIIYIWIFHRISPNKTVSGSIGSFIFSLIPIIIFLLIYEFTKNIEFRIHNHEFDNIIFLCLFTSLICQLGDLFISYYKRKAKIKDTGTILPGHGGLLDRIDGIIFVIPSVFIVDKIFF